MLCYAILYWAICICTHYLLWDVVELVGFEFRSKELGLVQVAILRLCAYISTHIYIYIYIYAS